MFRGNRKYLIILVLCFGALITLQVMAPKPIDWRLSYMSKDKTPYGTMALRESISELFPGQAIVEEKIPLYNSLTDANRVHTNYIIINNEFSPDTFDLRELLNFVERGNNAFIAVNYFGGKFADTLSLETDNLFNPGDLGAADSIAFANMTRNDTVQLNFVNPRLRRDKPYAYAKGVENTYFTKFDSSRTTILGTNSNNSVNFISVKFGRGQFLLCTVPEAFSNYHYAGSNHEYACKALSYLPILSTTWDEYYKIGNITTESPMRVLFNNISLRYAYYTLLISLVLFILIGIKRKQRIIPVIEPMRNTTLDFVSTVGTLYYQTGNHRNIAEKKIRHFLEFIRSTFQVSTTMYDDPFIDRVSNLSGVERGKVKAMFYYFNDISMKHTITQEELLKLNSMIEEFYKLNKR